MVFAQLPCELPISFQSLFYAYLSFARIFGIKTLPAYDLASYYTNTFVSRSIENVFLSLFVAISVMFGPFYVGNNSLI